MSRSTATAFLDPSVLLGIRNLMLRARCVVEGTLVGEHISPFRGGSVEFAQHRAYSPGDELRYVDWRLYARTDHHHVKQFEVTTNLRGYLLLDGSGSMGYPSGAEMTKYRYATLLAGAAAYVLTRQGDAVALALVKNGGVETLPARCQMAHLSRMLEVMEGHETAGEEGPIQLIRHARDRIHHRSLMLIFSDFFVDVPTLMADVKVLRSRGHDVALIQVLHPDELEFPFNRFYRFESMEDRSFLPADGMRIREEYLAALSEHRELLAQATRQAGVDWIQARTDEAPDGVLARFLNGPLRMRKLRRMY